MKKGNIIISAKKGSDTVDIYMYGTISEWADFRGTRLAELLNQYESKYKKLNIYLNTNGGSVVEGIAIFNILSRSKMEISIYVDGVAASMGFVLLQIPGAKRYMARFTRIMAHEVSGFAHGSIDDMRNTADQMEAFQNSLATIIGERTGKTQDEVTSWLFNSKDHWFDPDEALENKLIDKIVEGKASKDPKDLNNITDIISYYDEQITNFKNQNNDTMELVNIINHLGMPAGSDIKAVEAKVEATMKLVTTLQGEKKELEEKIEGFENDAEETKKTRVKDLVDNAITAKKITEDQRETYTTLANANYDSTKAALDAIATPQNLNSFINSDDNPIAEDRKGWTFQDWQKNDGEGLENLKANHQDVYQNLYDKAFPKKG
jgi:ATP-dependent Clp endopeptidase proteolytic subunit ClpP